MKPSNRIRPNGSAKRTAQQASTANRPKRARIEPPDNEFAELKEGDPGKFYLEWSNGARRPISLKAAASNFWLHQIPSALQPFLVPKCGVLGYNTASNFLGLSLDEGAAFDLLCKAASPENPQSAPAASPQGDDIISKAGREYANAMARLLNVGEAGITLLVLQTEAIAWRVNEDPDYEQVNKPGFVDGGNTFAELIAGRFSQSFRAYQDAGIALLNRVYDKRALMNHPEFAAKWNKTSSIAVDYKVRLPLENAADALARALVHQGELLSNHGAEGALELANMVADELRTASADCFYKSTPVGLARDVLETIEAEPQRRAA